MSHDSSVSPGEAQAQRLEAIVAQITSLVQQPDNAQRLRTAPGENEWTVMELLGHYAEMIPHWLGECRRVIQADPNEPLRFGRTLDDPGRLAGVTRGATAYPDRLLSQVQVEARRGAETIRSFTLEERARKGVHMRLGEITVADMIERLVVAHGEDHLKQLREALGNQG